MKKHSLKTASIFLALTLAMMGCEGGSMPGGGKIEAPELGLSMNVPSGWRVDRNNPRLFYIGNSTGIIMDEPLEGRNFREYVQQLSIENFGRLVDTESMTRNGYQFIQSVIEYPNAGSKALKAFIHKGDTLIEVSFVTPTDEFSEYEDSLRQSLASIMIE